MAWDREVLYQGYRKDSYENVIVILNKRVLTYSCICTRKEIADSSITGISGQIYTGICRNKVHSKNCPSAVQIRTNDSIIEFEDFFIRTY